MGVEDFPKIDLDTEDINEVRRWVSRVDLWLVENIECRFVSKAQTATKKLADFANWALDDWEAIKTGKVYVRVDSFEIIDGKFVKFTAEEVAKKSEIARVEKLAKTRQDHMNRLPRLRYHLRIVSTYLKKIQEWKDMSKKPKSKISNLPPINYEISLENEVIRDNQGNFYNLNQSHSGDFRVFAIAIFSGARLMESEVKKMIGINVKTGRKKYGGDADVFLYHYKKRMSSGKVGKKFETDWCIRDRDPRNQIMYYLNPKYRKLVTP